MFGDRSGRELAKLSLRLWLNVLKYRSLIRFPPDSVIEPAYPPQDCRAVTWVALDDKFAADVIISSIDDGLRRIEPVVEPGTRVVTCGGAAGRL